MKEQVDLLKSNGDVAGLIRFFLEHNAPEDNAKRRREALLARTTAATALAELGSSQAIDGLIEALDDSPGNNSYLLADALATIGGAKALEALLRMAQKHEDHFVRQGAAGALAANVDNFPSRREDVLDALESAFDDPEWLVRNFVAHRLRTKDPRIVDMMIRALSDPVHQVRESVANNLAFQQDPRGDEALRGLANSPSERLRNIARMKGAAVAAPAATTESVAGMIALVIGGLLGAVLGTLLGIGFQMATGIEGRLYFAFLVLGAFFGAAAGRGLVTWNRDRSLPKIQDLQQAGDVDALLEAFREGGPGRRLKAMKALVALKDPRSVEPFIEALAHPEKDVRQRAVRALGELGDPRAIDPLRAVKASGDQTLGAIAGAALRKLEG